MAIQISKAMISKLPPAERANIEEALWNKSGGNCFLCEDPLNRASDTIQADHDVPESDGGATDLANLNLAHEECNKAKRAAGTVPIRPYLKITRYAKKKKGRLKYDGFLEYFEIAPKPVVLTRLGSALRLELPDGSFAEANVMSESNRVGTFEYVFVQLPRSAIFNDDSCQPRAVRLDHVWSIYSDLQRNPLHEPPSCRTDPPAVDGTLRLLMFDGQHKTISNWMLGRDVVTAKVYLNLTQAQAIELVNSIQAKIKKLPLSPFELAGKMSDEWTNKFEQYEQVVGSAEVSEEGFLKWLGDKDEIKRGRQSLQSALVQNVLDSPDLRIRVHVKQPGAPAPAVSMTEGALKGKLIERLVHMSALAEKGENAQAVRDAEAATVIDCLNTLSDTGFEPADESAGYLDVELERGRRMCYQSALAYSASLIRALWHHITMRPPGSPMSVVLDDTQKQKLREGIVRIAAHPVWTADWNRDEKMLAVRAALEKNQEARPAMEAVGLDLSYVVVGDQSAAYRNYWLP